MNAKVSHLIAVVLIAAGQILQFLQGNPAIAEQMHVTATIMTIAGFLVALASQQLFGTPKPPQPAPLVDSVTKAASKIAPLACLAFFALAAAGLGANCSVTPQTQAAIVAAEQLGACVEDVYATDSEKVPAVTPVQIAIDEASTCGADVANLVDLFGSSTSTGKLAVVKAAQDNAASVHAAAASHR